MVATKMLAVTASLLVLVAAVQAASLRPARISLLSPRGIRFEIDDVAGMSLLGVHYSINSGLSGVNAGRWNFDIRSKTGGVWVHENRNVDVKSGDTVNYWLYGVINRLGTHLLNQRWVAGSSGPGRPTNPVDPSPSNPVNPSPSRPSSSSGGTLNGRPLKLVFEDNFNGGSLDSSKWQFDVSMWGGGNHEFQTYTPLRQNTYTKNGALFIKPTLTADKYGSSFLYSGTWDMNREFGYCTQPSNHGCKREGKYGMLPPIMSGRIKSKHAIKYGKVEVIAKLPRGDWIWPAIWMLPRDNRYGGWPRSGEIDIMEARGNRHFGNKGIEYMGSTLHWGSDWQHNRFGMTAKSAKVRSGTLADGYHKFTLLWDQSGLEFLLDDNKIVKYSTPNQGFWRWGNLPGRSIWHTNNAPFDQPFYMIINVAVGGTNGYIPDGVHNEGHQKPWRNSDGNAAQKFWQAKDKWYPTWKGEDAAMQIDSVKMWELQ